MWSGSVMSMISGSIPGPRIAPDTRKDVEPPPGQFACRGRAYSGRRTGYNGDLMDFR
jgi:hypothetical protein